jgi:KamA family protein
LTARNDYGRYRAVTERNLAQLPEWHWIDPQQQEAIQVVSRVLPFRTNEYVVRELIDWGNLPRDPIFQLVFPQRAMLSAEEYESVRRLLERAAPQGELASEISRVRYGLNPHPAGQLTHNVPRLNGRPLPGLQHKYRETVLFFPAQGQTCHAYCTYCFRWAQFVGMPEVKFESRETEDLIAYLKANPCVSDVLITGGDPMIMKTKVLRKYIEPLLDAGLENIQTIRIGTKSLAYWPQRFVTDSDADDCLRLFEQIVAAGKHLAVMAHYSHPAELRPEIAREAVRRVRSAGAQLRMQAPIIRHVNDNAQAWAELWREGVQLGMIPYYMFIERDTGARNYFEVPLARCHEVFRDAFVQVSGLGRTVRGPSMSAFPGKVRICGVTKVHGEKVFALEMIQARNPEWVGRPFFAKFDPHATWLDQLEPAFGERKFLFESDQDERHGLHAPTEFWGSDGADVRPI